MPLKRTARHCLSLFWPNLHNSFHPYAVRVPALAVVAVSMLLLQVVLQADSRLGDVLGLARDVEPSRLVELTNQARVAEGLEPLSVDSQLTGAAAAKAEHMVKHGYWSHYAPDGTTPWYFVHEAGYGYAQAGENLAKGFMTNDGVLAGWMNSPEHRDNLLDANYRDIGIATANGYIEGRLTTVVVAFYASPNQPLRVAANPAQSTGQMVLPATTTYSAIRPLNLLLVMPTEALLGLAVLMVLSLVYLGQHLVVRQKHLLWDKHIHPRPALQAVAIAGVVLVMVQASMGSVG